MKKLSIILACALVAFAACTKSNGVQPLEGIIDRLFTINHNGDQVYFSQGNLQYQASTNTWRFAENQWDFVGDSVWGRFTKMVRNVTIHKFCPILVAG